MLNLYWKTNGESRNLIDKPFTSEAEMEKYIYENQDLLGDVSVIYRQIKTGQKQGIPDMLGVDQDGRICIIELKNQTAGEDILPQALGYAIWAETNPDSIKAIWLESKHKPENITVDFDKLDIRIILIAPSFKNTVPRMAGKLGYLINLLQFWRYSYDDDNEFVSVETIEEVTQLKVKTTKVMAVWDWEYYESEHGKDATDQFRKVVEAISDFIKKQGWNLPYNINKYYTGFKLGNTNKVAFSVAWGGTYAWKVKFKLPHNNTANFKSKGWEFQTYDDAFGEAIFRPLILQNPDVSELAEFFNEAYMRVSGVSL